VQGILEAKLLPFAKEYMKERPNTIIQEDNTAPHTNRHQFRVYDLWGVARML
jgi:hypothetical protein